MTLEIALDADEKWDSSGGEPVDWEHLGRRAAAAAIAESAFSDLAESGRVVEISITLTSDEEVRSLNAKWRGKDKPTNVLSFPMADERDFNEASVADATLLLGDIILARGVCEAEAADKRISVEHHAAHLLVHGTLHLLGYDHQRDDEAAEMERCEIRALQRLGIANPYEVTA